MRIRLFYQEIIFCCVILAVSACSFADSNEPKPATEIVSKAVQENKIVYKLTTIEEFKQIAGQPVKETKKTDGDMEICTIEYSDIIAHFRRMKRKNVPFTIFMLTGKNGGFDIGQDRQIILRDINDLNKFDTFWGFAGLSLVNLDLREYKTLIDSMPFDSRTKWPQPNKLPVGFNPAQLLEEGKNPGLGIRNLHKEGIDGNGVCIAIIDQPLLKNHIEYKDHISHYEEIEVQGTSEMHGPPVCSIAVGKTCGVAPKASLYYYAVPPWKWLDNKPWADTLNKIIEQNKSLKGLEKIRVVSISLGAFSQRPNFDLWKQTVDKANQNGILVVTCDPTFLKIGKLRHKESQSADLPSSYEAVFNWPDADLMVLTDNRTIASYEGPDVYFYERQGGSSWAVPYLAGLAALAYQVNPEIEPKIIVDLWIQTALKTDAGPVVNPTGFIEAVRKLKGN